MIAVDAPTIAALSAPNVRLVMFLELALDAGVFVRYCSAGVDLVWNSATWNGMGAIIGVAPVREANGLEVIGWEVTLSGVPSDLLSLAASEDVVGRRASAWVGVYNEAGALVSTPFKKFEGRISDMPILDDPKEAKVVVRIESRMIVLTRPKASYWTHADQQKLYSTDDGLKFTDITAARTLKFGPRQ